MRRWFLLALAFALVAGTFFVLKDDRGGRLIVLITPDTLRRDHVGVYGGGRLTPRMDAFAKTAARFTEARSPVPLTMPAHVTMMAGLPPGATGIRTNAERLPAPGDRPYVLLPERLRDEGWHTAGFVSAAVLAKPTGWGEAFVHFDDGDLRDRKSLTVAERAGLKTVRQALAHLRSRPKDEDVFLWVHLFDPHAPYDENGRYAGGVRSVDAAIGALLDGIAREDACVLIAADHGEALGDLGELTHAVLLGDAVLRVPFLLRAPGVEAGDRAVPAELADIAPTLAAWAQIDWPTSGAVGSGRDLLGSNGRRASIAESMEGHRRYRWAQLIGASDEHGTLVDVGEGRFHWFPRAKPGEDQSGPEKPPRTDAMDRLVDAIGGYRALQTATAEAGGGSTPYAGGASAGPLLDPAENAKRPDPYQAIGRTMRLSKVSQAIAARQRSYQTLGAAINELKRLGRVDPENPEIDFWLGMAHRGVFDLASRERNPDRMAQAAPKAQRAFLDAFAKGRRDAATVVSAAGSNVEDPAKALKLLQRLKAQLPYEDCQVLVLEARLLRGIPGRASEADAVCARAKALCESEGRLGPWERTCAPK